MEAPPPEVTPIAEAEEEILNRIYIGDLENLPALSSKIVRIFTSSTFTGNFNKFEIRIFNFTLIVSYIVNFCVIK